MKARDGVKFSIDLEIQRARRLDCCDVGLFLYRDIIGFKNEYHEYYIVDTGEKFWGGCKSEEELDALVVTPLYIK